MIDIHCHILPGVDDGPRTVEEALLMARLAVASGVRRVVATPHLGGWEVTAAQHLVAQVHHLQRELNLSGIELTLAAGYEVRLSPQLLLPADNERMYTLNRSRYLLVELPAAEYPPYTEAIIFELQLRGLAVILAHPERNPGIQADPERMGRLVERGVLGQLTASSLLPGAERRIRHTAERLLKQGWVHVLASDAHDADGRAPNLAQGLAAVARQVGRQQAEAMATRIPEAILADRTIGGPAPRAEAMTRGWGWLPLR